MKMLSTLGLVIHTFLKLLVETNVHTTSEICVSNLQFFRFIYIIFRLLKVKNGIKKVAKRKYFKKNGKKPFRS